MITQDFVRGCGHTESLTLDETGPFYQRKLAGIARTRCKQCVETLKAKQGAEAAARRQKKHERMLECLRRHNEKMAAKQESGEAEELAAINQHLREDLGRCTVDRDRLSQRVALLEGVIVEQAIDYAQLRRVR